MLTRIEKEINKDEWDYFILLAKNFTREKLENIDDQSLLSGKETLNNLISMLAQIFDK